MKIISSLLFAALLIATPACLAQNWEVGGMAGGGFTNGVTVSTAQGNATAGFAHGLTTGVLLGQTLYSRVSGELRYSVDFSDLRISDSATSATFKGQTHSIHYDILLSARSREARVRPFVLAGGGMRDFRGVGTEAPYQPLSSFALLTKTSQWVPVVTFGGGIKYAISPRVLLRFEVRDYFSRFPTQVIAPAPDAHLSGWLNDLVAMAGLSFVF
ncbi:MAG TPA: hypothetical protein VK335_00055 [Bryobacteraceae bacterium]|nr:hypothetical protein [Bryobacteraceae bacterium]